MASALKVGKSMAELASLYKRAVGSSDVQLAGVAESAAMRIAAGEAALAEARSMLEFVSESAR
jgi:hypothetical protein